LSSTRQVLLAALQREETEERHARHRLDLRARRAIHAIAEKSEMRGIIWV
jgi:hypothetical protein